MSRVSDYEKGGMQKASYGIDEVIIRDCPLCGTDNYVNIYKERGAIGIVKCNSCGLIYVNPMVKEPERNYWGQEQRYYQEGKLIFEGKRGCHRDPNYLEDLSAIKRIKPTGNFLDVGTNAGFFLRHTRSKGWNVYGVEPSPVLSEMARRYFGLNVKTAYLGNAGFEDNFFDVVTMTDVFEHIPEPKKILLDIKRVLKEDGILFIKVPNGGYNLLKLKIAKIFGKLGDYDIFNSYEHVTHFTHFTLKKILEESGFNLKKVLIGRPIQLPVWHKYVGHFYVYPSPWVLDPKNHILRVLFYCISKVERILRFGSIGYFAPNIIVIAVKKSVCKMEACNDKAKK